MPVVSVRLFIHVSIINIFSCALASKSPLCAGSRVSTFPNTLFMAALQIPPLPTHSEGLK